MAISKPLRYEIYRRDNFTCRYCGASAPDTTITIDHVTPVTLGGTDEPTNLVTACTSCNSGKSATPPDAPLVDDVTQDALRWSRAMQLATSAALRDLEQRQALREWFKDLWDGYSYGPFNKPVPLPDDWANSIDQLNAAGLGLALIEEAVNVAMRSTATMDNKWRYFCGVCYRKISQIQEHARALLTVEETEQP